MRVDHSAVELACSRLEPLPPTASRLATACARADVDIDEIVSIIQYDPSLTGRLLRIANSASSASLMPVSTVRDAVIRVGTSVTLGLAIGTHAQGFLTQPIPAYGFRERELWKHSVAAAISTEEMRSLELIHPPPEAFATSLLHDIGKIVLGRLIEPDSASLLRYAVENANMSLDEAELEMLGVRHSEVGQIVAQQWKLPSAITNGIGYHHTPMDNRLGDSAICFIVQLADLVAKCVDGSEAVEDLTGTPAARSTLRELALQVHEFTALCRRTAERLDEVLSWYH